MLARIALVVFLCALGVTPAMGQGGVLVLQVEGQPSAGGTFCFKALADPSGPAPRAIVTIGAVSTTVSGTSLGDGWWEFCFPVPPGTGGYQIDIRVVAGLSVKTESRTIGQGG